MLMRSYIAWIAWAALAAIFSVAGVAQSSPATAPASPEGTIKVARVTGEVYAVDHATGLKTRLSTSSLVSQGQAVETGANANVILVLSNGAIVNVKANSVLEVSEFTQNPFSDNFQVREAMHEPSISTTHLMLRQGEIISQVKKLNRDAGSSFTVETPMGAAGIRGTAFRIGYTFEGSTAHFILSMAEGLIRFVPVQGHAVEVPAGKQISLNGEISPSTHAITTVGAIGAPTDESPAEAAALQQEVTDTIGSGLNVDFSPTGSTTTSAGNVATPNKAAASSDSTDTPTSPAPGAINPEERVSPQDGVPRS